MGDASRRSTALPPVFDPYETPLPRRRVLVLMGTGALAAGGLATLLEGCSPPPVMVTVDFDVSTLEAGKPVEVPFTVPESRGDVPGSAWMVRQAGGEITAFDPRCTHALCIYRWEADARRFKCHCHEGTFAIDGAVLSGPPPRALNRFPLQVVGDTMVVEVPGDFRTPRESIPG